MKTEFYPESAEGKWDNIEIHPVFDDGSGIVEVCEEGEETYWSVYLHQVSGGVQCVADVPSKELAIKLTDLIKTLVTSIK